MSPDLFGHDESARDDPLARDEFARDDPLAKAPADAPLAERMRPRTLDDYVGQEHLVGKGRILRRMLEEGLTQSLILWGPPGSGKTTLARILAAGEQDRFVPFSAVMSGIKEIRAVMAESAAARVRDGRRTVLFVDEIHRFNKAQQDAFLPYVERGDILLIGATTENPSFEIVGPLLSRSRTVVLKPLAPEVMVQLLRRALTDEQGLAGAVQADDDVLLRLAHSTDGDARRGLTLLETAALLAESAALESAALESEKDGPATIDQELLGEALQQKLLLYDKSGEEHFNLISALHKSVRTRRSTGSRACSSPVRIGAISRAD